MAMRFIIFTIFISIFSINSNAREIVENKLFGDWVVEISQDEWGDKKEIVLKGQNQVEISIDPEFGFVFQNYNFPVLRNYWPYCEITDFTYRIDGKEPVRTSMGGKAASGGSCARISMPKSMYNHMKEGKLIEVRVGYSNPQRKSLSLVGFSEAWSYAQTHCKTSIKID